MLNSRENTRGNDFPSAFVIKEFSFFKKRFPDMRIMRMLTNALNFL